VEEKHLDDLRQHTQQQRAWGSERSRQQIEALTQRSVSQELVDGVFPY
jgi:putative transposase